MASPSTAVQQDGEKMYNQRKNSPTMTTKIIAYSIAGMIMIACVIAAGVAAKAIYNTFMVGWNLL